MKNEKPVEIVYPGSKGFAKGIKGGTIASGADANTSYAAMNPHEPEPDPDTMPDDDDDDQPDWTKPEKR